MHTISTITFRSGERCHFMESKGEVAGKLLKAKEDGDLVVLTEATSKFPNTDWTPGDIVFAHPDAIERVV